MKKTYINPSIVVVDMETEVVMINTSPGDATVYDTDDEGTIVTVGTEWSLGDNSDLWDEDWSE